MLSSTPEKLKQLINGREYTTDSVGLSGSAVLLFENMVLKIQSMSDEARSEHSILQWLSGKLHVPECFYYGEKDGKSYLLMSRIRGRMSCDDEFMTQPQQLVKRLADCLRQLWSVDISDCPVNSSLDRKLAAAEERVRRGVIDIADAEPGTYGENGFRDPEHLLQWLRENRPEEDIVFSHGDFCLPNIFFDEDSSAGYIDLGRAGTSDRWLDIAICLRSLMHNFEGVYSGKAYPGFEPAMLFDALGIEPDWKKINYYIMLDELF